MMRRFCMSGVRRQSGTCPDLLPCHLVAIAEHSVRRGQQPVAFIVKRDRADLAERFVLQIRQPGIDLQVFQKPEHGDRGAGYDAETHIRVTDPERRGQRGGHAERGRNRRDRDLAGQAVLERIDLLPHGAGVADNAPRQSSVRSPSGVKPWNREPRCTSITPRISSSCLRLVDIVGWVTPQASAARPK